jgi:hypothetical protein
LIQQIPNNLHPGKYHLLFLYINALLGHFGFMLRDTTPKTLEEAQEMVAKIEVNISSCKVETFYALRSKAKNKPRSLHNVYPTQDISTPWEQRIEEAINDLAKNKTLVMKKITNLERVQQQDIKPPFRDEPQISI